MALGCRVDADPDAEEHDVGLGYFECARRIRDSVKGWIVGAEPTVTEFNPVPRGSRDNFPFEERIGGAGRLHGVSNGTAKTWNERCKPAVGLTRVGLEDHGLLIEPVRGHNANPGLHRVELRIPKYRCRKRCQLGGLCLRQQRLHDRRNVFLI